MASLVKIMTAHLVLRLIDDHQGSFDETVEISSRAAGTWGSTAGLEAAEHWRQEDLLYALLLCSGNDAATALAEHWGARLSGLPAGDGAEAAFVEAMNERAEALGLDDTRFANPHGLTSDLHHSTAHDVLQLCRVALNHELFRRVVGEREYCASEASGRRRNLWRNTNQLLGDRGFHGVKTGRTGGAGYCLAALNRTAGREHLMVILGAPDSEQRFAAARVLGGWLA